MMILVRAITVPKKPSNVLYELSGKSFPMGTDIELIRDYVNSLLSDHLNAMDIKIIRHGDTDSMLGIDAQIEHANQINFEIKDRENNKYCEQKVHNELPRVDNAG